MYLTVSHQTFKPAIATVQALAASSKTLLPILKNVLLVADATGLALHASNEEASIRYHLSAEVQAPGAALLPAHLLAGLVHDLPSAPLTLLLPSPTDATAAQLRCASVKATLKQSADAVDEFPPIPRFSEGGGRELLTLDCELLREIVEQVAFVASTDLSRPVLTGMRMAFHQGQASFGAADAFRLAVRTIAIPDQQLEAEIIIPAQPLRHLARLLPDSGSVLLALTPQGRQVLVQHHTMDVAIRLLEGRFLAYDSLLAIQPTTSVVLPTRTLADAVHFCAPFARENKHQVCLHVHPATGGHAAAVVVVAEAADLGRSEIRLDDGVSVTGPGLTLLLNAGYLAEALSVLRTREVALECTQPNRPVVVKPVGPLEQVCIIMPLTVQSTPAAAHRHAPTVAVTATPRAA